MRSGESVRYLAQRASMVFDWIEVRWERTATRESLGTALVTLFPHPGRH
ncbi:hypothetical protein BH11GEM2_BH11GEM2_22260 [soil metagenome]